MPTATAPVMDALLPLLRKIGEEQGRKAMTGVFGVVLGQILLMFSFIIGYVLFYRTGLITQEGSKALAHLSCYRCCSRACAVLTSAIRN